MESEPSSAVVNKNATKIECLQLNIWEALHLSLNFYIVLW